METKTRPYDELMAEFTEHWDAAAKLAKEINAHPDKPAGLRATQIEPTTKQEKAPASRDHWPAKLDC